MLSLLIVLAPLAILIGAAVLARSRYLSTHGDYPLPIGMRVGGVLFVVAGIGGAVLAIVFRL